MKKTIILIILLAIVFFNSEAFASTIKFAQISDLHYQSNILRKNINYYSLLIIDEVAEEINKDKDIKLTLITGDIINKRKKDDAKFIFEHFNEIFEKPWYSVFGNHDLGGHLFFKMKLIYLLKNINKIFSHIKTDHYSFRPNNDMVFIGLNSNYTTKRTPIGYISKKQINFLKDTLSKVSDNDVIVIFMHHTPIKFPLVHVNHFISNEEIFMEILKSQTNPILLLGGHYHSCKIEKEKNIIKVATPSLSTLPLAYRTITIDNLASKTIFKFEYKTVNNELQNFIFRNIKKEINPYREGGKSDKNIKIEISK